MSKFDTVVIGQHTRPTTSSFLAQEIAYNRVYRRYPSPVDFVYLDD